jgi:hypothetical protein
LAVNVGAVAIPLVLVAAVAVVDPPVKVPLAPDDGAVKVTVAPFTGLLATSLTLAWKAVANAVPVAVLCGVPLVAVMLAGAPATFVRL